MLPGFPRTDKLRTEAASQRLIQVYRINRSLGRIACQKKTATAASLELNQNLSSLSVGIKTIPVSSVLLNWCR
jgi:hypothetical protein